MASQVLSPSAMRGGPVVLNTRHHKFALGVLMLVVLAHWAEHVVQAIQIWVLGRPVPQARGVLGERFPWLIRSEWLHYGYALAMLVGLILLRPGFTGRSRVWQGAFHSDDGTVNRGGVYLYGGDSGVREAGQVRARDIGRPGRVYRPRGSHEWFFTAVPRGRGAAPQGRSSPDSRFAAVVADHQAVRSASA